jgi:hypothetical protein
MLVGGIHTARLAFPVSVLGVVDFLGRALTASAGELGGVFCKSDIAATPDSKALASNNRQSGLSAG